MASFFVWRMVPSIDPTLRTKHIFPFKEIWRKNKRNWGRSRNANRPKKTNLLPDEHSMNVLQVYKALWWGRNCGASICLRKSCSLIAIQKNLTDLSTGFLCIIHIQAICSSTGNRVFSRVPCQVEQFGSEIKWVSVGINSRTFWTCSRESNIHWVEKKKKKIELKLE